MLTAFGRAFTTPDLRKKLLFTLAIMAVFRLGSHVPTPGISYELVHQCQKAAGPQGSLLGLANLFSGGALLQLSIFALGIMPYITASIIIQLLTVVIPRFEQLKKEGQSGQTKMTQYTRYLTIGLAVLQSSTLITTARNPWNLLGGSSATCPTIMNDQSVPTMLIMILTLTAGTGLIMWLGEQVTERGVGNGMSLLILTSIAASVPASVWAIHNQGWGKFILVVVMGLIIITAVVFVENAQRRIPVQYAKRMIGRRSYGGTSTYIPLKVNMANVIPLIFASSLLSLPVLLASFNRPDPGSGERPSAWVEWVTNNLSKGDHPFYMLLFTVLILFFTFFYVSITYQPDEVADNLKQAGSFIPGVRAGQATAQYLSYVLTRITVVGAIYLSILALIPLIALAMVGADQNFPFGGASIIILVGVGLETVKQIDSKLQQHHYEGFLR
ncbi:preprotein translocase subunit SecY [Luteipulveratus sp. YIM 133132]|uniref:Protein translocase subunit SecY n=1 Tax=Luteipulveratus flavus TaxID=3031728 RepID=A0ABT6C6A8_9MICO|nr:MULTISPECIES: preprotein translocase subunit SecY [unclassified Luteipulveratus]MDE9365273.1 preprotein translocase subunit SecY [Luteipulveratus sp. YIM 133132]MDF8264390.1 preprotein translocase subunit SecY [Luteipulveratus sp. YIM 133296]